MPVVIEVSLSTKTWRPFQGEGVLRLADGLAHHKRSGQWARPSWTGNKDGRLMGGRLAVTLVLSKA